MQEKNYCDTDGRKPNPGWPLTSIPTQEVREEDQDLFSETLSQNLKQQQRTQQQIELGQEWWCTPLTQSWGVRDRHRMRQR